MINIITNKNLVTEDYVIFDNPEAFVISKVASRDFNELDKFALKEIDGANIIDSSCDTVKTKFGYTTINNLSTGCKTVLMYLYYYKHKDFYGGKVVIDTTECGWNSLDVLFECAERLNDVSTLFYLTHKDSVFKCKHREYLVDKCRSLTDLLFL